MIRVFAGLSGAHLILLATTAGLGFFAESVGQERHILLGTLAVIFSCLIQVSVFTYLTVTFKYAAQIAHLGKLELGFIPQARSFKKHVTRLLGMVFLLNLLVTASGSAHWRENGNGWLHLLAAAAVIFGHGVAYYFEFDIIYRNNHMVSDLLRRFEQRRTLAGPATAKAQGPG